MGRQITKEAVLEVLDFDWKATNEIKTILKNKGIQANWYTIQNRLLTMMDEGKVERLSLRKTILYRLNQENMTITG